MGKVCVGISMEHMQQVVYECYQYISDSSTSTPR